MERYGNGARTFIIVVTGIILAVIITFVGVVSLNKDIDTTSNQAKENEDILRIILAVTGCTLKDTPEQCANRQVERSKQEGIARVADVECRIRRALAGLPSPKEGTKCQI